MTLTLLEIDWYPDTRALSFMSWSNGEGDVRSLFHVYKELDTNYYKIGLFFFNFEYVKSDN